MLMKTPLRMMCGLLLLSAVASQAQASQTDGLMLSYKVDPGQTTVIADLTIPGVDRFYLFVSAGPDFDLGAAAFVTVGSSFDPSRARATVEVPQAQDLSQYDLTVAAVYRDPATHALYVTGGSRLNFDLVICAPLTWSYDPNSVATVAGDEAAEQWASLGIHISGVNNVAAHPDKVLFFDSANFSGEDVDLQTPGYGSNNDTPFEKLLIIAEDDVDVNPADGLVDDPDDERFGGTITFTFDTPVDICGATLIDIDSNEHCLITGYDGGGFEVGNVLVQALDDNSRQTILFTLEGLSRLTFEFAGSGGIGELGWSPCPARIDFDSLIAGDPLNFLAGTEITNQFDYLGVHFTADNFFPGHPDKLIIFDTANPTGGDNDLATPGYHPSNTVPKGMVIIIAENDIDTNPADGLVDVPDDEEGGGLINIVFDIPVIFEQATVLDVEDLGSFWRFYDSANNLLLTVPLAAAGDNSVQTINPNIAGVSRAELELETSGAITDLVFCPTPRVN